eukprot:Pgem_evm1s598
MELQNNDDGINLENWIEKENRAVVNYTQPTYNPSHINRKSNSTRPSDLQSYTSSQINNFSTNHHITSDHILFTFTLQTTLKLPPQQYKHHITRINWAQYHDDLQKYQADDPHHISTTQQLDQAIYNVTTTIQHTIQSNNNSNKNTPHPKSTRPAIVHEEI